MASILDSFKEVCSERLSFLKILVLAVPTYFSYYIYQKSIGFDLSTFYFFAVVTLFFVFGFLIQVAGNVINDRSSIIPPLNPVLLAFSAIKGIVAIGPIALICSMLANFICSFINFIPWLDTTLKTLVWIVFSSIMIASFLMFSNSEKPSDAFKLKTIFERLGDLIASVLFFIIQSLCINLVTAGFVGYVIYVLLGFGPVFDFFIASAVIFNLTIFGHYWGQVHHEILSLDNPN